MFQAQKIIKRKYVKYTCSMETVQQNGRFTLFLVNSPLIYILFFLVLVHGSWLYRKDNTFNTLNVRKKKLCRVVSDVSSFVGDPVYLGLIISKLLIKLLIS